VRVLERDPVRDAVMLHRRLAYVPGDVSLWPNLSGGEAIDLFGALRGGLDPRRRAELLDRFELDPTKRARTYSKGNRQKVAIVAAFASDVELYILDEPTSGLDPLMEAAFQECVREVRAQGRTVLLSSHVLAEVEALCDRVTIIRAGRTVESGTLDELRHLSRTSVSVRTRAAATGLTDLPGVHDLAVTDGRTRFEVESGAMAEVLDRLQPLGVLDLSATPPTLEELFLRHYAGEPAAPSRPAQPASGRQSR
jgi:ABC-2 type transport system ATP-binding protein